MSAAHDGGVADQDRGELGRYVKQLREAAGLSQVGLSRATGGVVTDSHIAAIEVGNRGLSQARVELLAEALAATSEQQRQLLRLAGHLAPEGLVSTSDRLGAVEDRIGRLEGQVARLLRQGPAQRPRKRAGR